MPSMTSEVICAAMTQAPGSLLRGWRRRRHLSQMELAHRAAVSTRHVSFVETGRSRPTADMVLRLCEQLDVPLRERNTVLLAAGHAPAYREHGLSDPPMRQVNAAIEGILAAHLPFPALVVDRRWELVSANEALYALLDGVPPHLVEPPVNVIRLSVHPEGLAPRIANLEQWRAHLIHRLSREHDASADAHLAALLEELGAEDGVPGNRRGSAGLAAEGPGSLLVPLQLRVDGEVLSFLSTTTLFGTPHEVTLSELAIEAFYPADERTRELVLGATAARPPAAARLGDHHRPAR